MIKVPPPVLGFNNNVRHRGRIFHIQTEDSGVKNPRIVTHLFADGGRIIKTARTDYAQHLERVDITNVVRQMMKAQHKAMFTSLRAGDLDAMLEAACGPLPLPLPVPLSRDSGALAAPESPRADAVRSTTNADPAASGYRAKTNPNLRAVEPPARSTPVESGPVPVTLTSVDAPPPLSSLSPLSSVVLDGADAIAAAESARVRKSSPTAIRKPPVTRADRSTLSRPASRYGSAPTKTAQSIFGDGVISEKSLDEVILSYLADDLDGSSE